MDAEKIELYFRLLNLSKSFSNAMNVLAENPEDGQALEAVSYAFPVLRPHLPDDLAERILYLFSGAEIEPEDLRKVGQQLQNTLSENICKSLVEWMSQCTYVECPDAGKLFALLDEIPNRSQSFYQVVFDLCVKASLSSPMQAFQHTLRIMEEQPGLLSGKGMPHPGYVYKPSQQRTFQCCPICGGAGKPYYRAFSYAMADFGYPHLPIKLWMKCDECGNFYTWKHPEEYFVPSKCEKLIFPEKKNDLQALGPANGQIFSIWSNILNKLTGYSNGKSVLEVGIGQGALLAVALEMGYEADAVEIMPNTAQNIANILGIPIWNGDFLNYRTEKTYSIITMGDVIEHISNPGLALRCAYKLLKREGVLWLSTPNFESAFSRMRKFTDPMWLEPGHVSYFSYRGLEALANKCGFEVKEYTVSNRYNGSMELILTKKDQEGGAEP